MSADLDTLNDAQLSEVFAVEVAGFVKVERPPSSTTGPERLVWTRPVSGAVSISEPYLIGAVYFHHWELARFATSADAVLPIIGACWIWYASKREDGKHVCTIMIDRDNSITAVAATLPRAICCALILAKRAENGGAK